MADISLLLFDVAILLSHANSAVNFFLYSWRLNTFREELHKKVTSKLPNPFRRVKSEESGVTNQCDTKLSNVATSQS